MRRKIVVLLLVLFVVGSCAGCFSKERERMEKLWPEAERISYKFLGDHRVEFQGNVYYLSNVGFLETTSQGWEEYEYLGWSGELYRNRIYADAKENPIILCFTNGHTVYLREDYNYRTDEFTIDGIDATICFSEDLPDADCSVNIFGRPTIEVELSSVNYPKVRVRMYVFFYNGQWYAQSRLLESHVLSDDFVSILAKNRIIPHS